MKLKPMEEQGVALVGASSDIGRVGDDGHRVRRPRRESCSRRARPRDQRARPPPLPAAELLLRLQARCGRDARVVGLELELKREGWPIGVSNVMLASVNTPFFDKTRTKLGRRPMSLTPVYPPRSVAGALLAGALLYVAERAPRDRTVCGAGKAMLLRTHLSLRCMDAIMGPMGYRSQQMEEHSRPRKRRTTSTRAPGGGREGRGQPRGRWAVSRSLSTWLDTHPAAKAGLVAATALGSAANLRAARAG